MIRENFLKSLPDNYRNEKIFLLNSGFNNWYQLSQLSDSLINGIIHKEPMCTESRLKKIRTIANFVFELDISPHQAYILLHSGISSLEALSIHDPHILEKKIGRMKRKLNSKLDINISLKFLSDLILKAKKILN